MSRFPETWGLELGLSVTLPVSGIAARIGFNCEDNRGANSEAGVVYQTDFKLSSGGRRVPAS